MKSPYTGKEMSIQKEWRPMTYRKEEFMVCFHTWHCEDSGEQFEDDNFAQLNHNQVLNQYRAKHFIPIPKEIRAIREKYGLNKIKMSEVMGFGANVYRQYEDGEMPSQSNARFIQLAADPREFRKLLDISKALDDVSLEKTLKIIKKLLEEQKAKKEKKLIEKYLFGCTEPNLFNGFRTPELEKFAEMVLFFSEKLQPWKTKLNKLLFYTDFTFFKLYGQSISGAKYCAIDMGPVPDNFNSIYDYLVKKEIIKINYTPFTNGGLGEQFFALKKFNAGLFQEEELSVLNDIFNRFNKTTTSDIIDISHKEEAWIKNHSESNKDISYLYAFDLKH